MRQRWRLAGPVALALAAGGFSGCKAQAAKDAHPDASARSGPTTAPTVPRAPLPAPSSTSSTLLSVAAAAATGSSLVAQALVPKIPVHIAMSATAPVATTLTDPNEDGAPLVFLVDQRQPGWLLVDLPVRPNGSKGWIDASLVRVTVDPYRVVVERRAHQLTLYQDNRPALRVPVGIGTSETPTPGGVFYIKELLQPPSPNGPYGPYAFGLSGYSDALKSFAGGNGVIGLHGTNEPQFVGKDVSHGCIRLYNADILRLVQLLPLGTPVEVLA
jgi:lipoprotein-anchoring transpeptidase ErfK/SrfK